MQVVVLDSDEALLVVVPIQMEMEFTISVLQQEPVQPVTPLRIVSHLLDVRQRANVLLEVLWEIVPQIMIVQLFRHGMYVMQVQVVQQDLHILLRPHVVQQIQLEHVLLQTRSVWQIRILPQNVQVDHHLISIVVRCHWWRIPAI